jgi:hypothetical protein
MPFVGGIATTSLQGVTSALMIPSTVSTVASKAPAYEKVAAVGSNILLATGLPKIEDIVGSVSKVTTKIPVENIFSGEVSLVKNSKLSYAAPDWIPNTFGSISTVMTSSFDDVKISPETGNPQSNIITGNKLSYTPPSWVHGVENFVSNERGGTLFGKATYSDIGNPATVNPLEQETISYKSRTPTMTTDATFDKLNGVKPETPADIIANATEKGQSVVISKSGLISTIPTIEQITEVSNLQVKTGLGIGAEQVDTGIGKINIDNPQLEFPGKNIVTASATGRQYVAFENPLAPPQSILGGADDVGGLTPTQKMEASFKKMSPESLADVANAQAHATAEFEQSISFSPPKPTNLLDSQLSDLGMETSPLTATATKVVTIAEATTMPKTAEELNGMYGDELSPNPSRTVSTKETT